jgi:ketosteroid isomerase-like protein
MKHFLSILLCFTIVYSPLTIHAQTKQEIAVKFAVEKLTAAMISGERVALETIASSNLSYGHSGGHVEGRVEFVEKIATGKSDFVSIDITEQTISVTGKTAIVRHLLTAVTNDNGKPGNVKLKVLLVFSKEQGGWRLLARQAVKA